MAGALGPAEQRRIDALYDRLLELRDVSVGYPCNQAFDYRPLYRFLGLVTNNVGDPFAGSNFRMNTHEFELDVLRDFARFTRIASDRYWGYVTNGGTEGNMYGLYLARELFPDGIVYYSEHTHYSVPKILRLQHTRSIMIRSQPNGEIDYEDLEESLKLHRDVPPILFANIGTTMTGAMDDVARIRGILDRLCIQNRYIHVDAALAGMILPFVDDPPPWDFSAGIDSLSISGHKMIGSPLPCGIVLAEKAHVERIARSVEYVGVNDTTISGSRNAFTPLILWYALRTRPEKAFRAMVKDCFEVADEAIERLAEIGVEAWRFPNSITVVFPRPPAVLMKKWILAPYGDIGHLITVPSVDRATVERFVGDWKKCLEREPLWDEAELTP